MTLIKTVGGASGPLYGTFFLRAAGALDGDDGRAVAAAGRSLDEALDAAAEAAAAGRDATEPLVARKGRASYLGERSAGHVDPGVASATLLVQAAATALTGRG